MKFFFVLMFSVMLIKTQAQSTAAQELANRIAHKMKDSLKLTEAQQTDIYNVNIQLQTLKTNARTNYTNQDSLRSHFQLIENTRDSLYRAVLPYGKFQLYLQKKTKLINNN